ncbi:MAG: helicase-related protein, partial [Eubacteriales bacterium]|nr:helicase-related protein [Eubacteriales bacterium]
AEKPAGRGTVETYTVRSGDLPRVNALIEKELSAGRQAYVVCPLLAESENNEAEAAEEVYKELSQKDFRNYRLALLYGGMKAEEKAQILLSFLRKELDLLVSTTVIEVGIDNPNASIMLIRNAERFGLAQLHQLRGRIGRGEYRSLCILHSDVPEGLARERLRTLCREDDGFKIAEADLQLRGPGQFFGTRQHGINEFKLAYAYADEDLLSEVEQALETESLNDANLRAALEKRFPELQHGETL